MSSKNAMSAVELELTSGTYLFFFAIILFFYQIFPKESSYVNYYDNFFLIPPNSMQMIANTKSV